MTLIEAARLEVAGRFDPRSRVAHEVFQGQWDQGKLIQDALARLRFRRMMHIHRSR